MSDAPPDLRRMLDTARGLDAPTGVDRDQMLQRLLSDVTQPPSSRGLRAPHLALTGIGLVLVALVALVAWPRATTRPVVRAPAPRPASAPAAPPVQQPVATPQTPSPAEPPPAPTAPVVERPLVVASATPRRAAPTQPASAPEDEWRIIREADGALRSHDPDRALAVLARHATRHPRGVAAPEVLAYRVRAYCMAGRHAEALAVARELRARAPDSPAAYSLRATCASQP